MPGSPTEPEVDELGEIREAARAIRAYLPSLLDADAASELDAALAALLAAPDEPAAVDEALVAELERYEATAEWTAAFLEHGMPPELAVHPQRSFSGLPGYGETVQTPKFVCPEGDYVWYRHAVGQEPPHCPTHGELVVPAGGPG
jgi:hypothetical protein